MAIFSDGKKTHFGQEGGSTYIDHHSINKRFNYLKRHDVNEDWDDPYKASVDEQNSVFCQLTNLDKQIK